jgi:phosphohistidine phosphatase
MKIMGKKVIQFLFFLGRDRYPFSGFTSGFFLHSNTGNSRYIDNKRRHSENRKEVNRMDIYILRHGKAGHSSGGPKDSTRALTPGGRKEIRNIARWMQREKIEFDVIASSPLIRASETAKIIARTLERKDLVVTWDDLAPGGDLDTVCYNAAQCRSDGAILVIGHEPALSGLIGKIISHDGTASVIFAKGGLAKVRNFSFDRWPSGVLQWLLNAKQIQAMQ